MLNYVVTVNGVEHRVRVIARRGGELTFETDGVSYSVSIAETPRKPTKNEDDTVAFAPAAARKIPPPVEMAEPGCVVAPIPGVISAIRVTEGQTVNPGDVLVVLEAMKMENNITASTAGTVVSIAVAEGSQVRKGQILIKLT